MGVRKHPRLRENDVDVLAAAAKDGLIWLPRFDRFMISDGYRSAAGRKMLGAGYIRLKNPRVPVILPALPRSERDGFACEITPDGEKQFRTQCGDTVVDALLAIGRGVRS